MCVYVRRYELHAEYLIRLKRGSASWIAPFNEKPDSYPLMDLQAALDAARTCKAPPGKAKANEYLKRCRADMKMVGERVDVEVKMPEFHWRAYVAYHPKATAIFKCACGEILGRGVPRR